MNNVSESDLMQFQQVSVCGELLVEAVLSVGGILVMSLDAIVTRILAEQRN